MPTPTYLYLIELDPDAHARAGALFAGLLDAGVPIRLHGVSSPAELADTPAPPRPRGKRKATPSPATDDNPRRTSHDCDVCSKSFDTAQGLALHKTRVHKRKRAIQKQGAPSTLPPSPMDSRTTGSGAAADEDE